MLAKRTVPVVPLFWAFHALLTELPPGTPEGFAHLRWTLEANRRVVRAEEQFLVRGN